MSGTELEKFRKRTRWVYYSQGVAYGPFSVDEIFDMIDEGVISRDTELMELGTNRRIPLHRVGLFLERAQELDERLTREMEEAEFENTRTKLGRSRGVQFYLVNIGVPLVLILAVILGVFWKNIFGSGQAEDPGAIHVAEEGPVEGGGAGSEEGATLKAAEPVFVEAESPLEGELEDYALGLTMEGADQASVEAFGQLPVAAKAKKLPKVVTVNRRPTKKKSPAATNPPAGGPKAVESGVVELNFSEDELEAESVGLGSGDGVEGLVRERLQPVLRQCAGKGASEMGLPPDVMARVKVRPTGSLGNLKLTVEPKVGYSEIRMCVIAGMAGIRVPPFQGDALMVTTTN